jgi:hypothetical protein
VGLSLVESEDLVDVEPGVHARDHCEFPGRRQRQVALVELGLVALVVAKALVGDAHRNPS